MRYLKLYENFGKNKNALDLLIDLTEFTVPHGNEDLMYDKIKSNCNKNLNKDEFGNLFINIGESKILFSAHLDTYSKKVEKIKHVIDNNFLKTDESKIILITYQSLEILINIVKK